MLKPVPPFREREEWLLICAAHLVRGLDTAFLRQGRFDYLIPVGPPDDQARQAKDGRDLRWSNPCAGSPGFSTKRRLSFCIAAQPSLGWRSYFRRGLAGTFGAMWL